MKHIKKFNESKINESGNLEPVEKLVERILDACKLDVDVIKESDPEFIEYISDMIQEWAKNN